jgi:hypothetical protein
MKVRVRSSPYGKSSCEPYLLAIRAIHDMVKAPDFDRKILLLATQISHQSEMKGVLLAVLENLLKTLKIGSNAEVAEAITLNRCIIKLILSLLVEPAANRCVRVIVRLCR